MRERKSNWLDFQRAIRRFGVTPNDAVVMPDPEAFMLPYDGDDEAYLAKHMERHPFLQEQVDKGHATFECTNGTIYSHQTLKGILAEIRNSDPKGGIHKHFLNEGFNPELPDDHPTNQEIGERHWRYRHDLVTAAKGKSSHGGRLTVALNF